MMILPFASMRSVVEYSKISPPFMKQKRSSSNAASLLNFFMQPPGFLVVDNAVAGWYLLTGSVFVPAGRRASVFRC